MRRSLVLLGLGAVLVLGGCSTPSTSEGGSSEGGSGGGGGGDQAAAGGDQAAAAGDIADKAPEEIFAAAGEAFQNASSVTVASSTVGPNGGTLTLEGQLTRQGDAHMTSETDTSRIELIKLGDQTWFRSPDIWDNVNPNIGDVVGDRWVLVTPAVVDMGITSGMDRMSDMAGFGSALLAPGEGPLEKVEGETVDGVPTIGLRDGTKGTVHVAAEGEPYPLLVTPPSDQDQSQRMELSGYNEPPSITAPEDAIEDLVALLNESATAGG